MPHSVDIVTECDRWNDASIAAITRAGRAAMDVTGVGDGAEIVVLACDDARISDLNGSFRGKGTATNVLSWPTYDFPPRAPGATPPMPPMPELGDIALAFETCMAEAAQQGKEFDHHIMHLVVHGVLHLLGYDHECDADATLMEQLEIEILATLGVSDPYRTQNV